MKTINILPGDIILNRAETRVVAEWNKRRVSQHSELYLFVPHDGEVVAGPPTKRFRTAGRVSVGIIDGLPPVFGTVWRTDASAEEIEKLIELHAWREPSRSFIGGAKPLAYASG